MDHQAITCLGTHPDSSKSKDWFSYIKGCGRQPGQWRSRSGIATCWNGHARLAGPRDRLMDWRGFQWLMDRLESSAAWTRYNCGVAHVPRAKVLWNTWQRCPLRNKIRGRFDTSPSFSFKKTGLPFNRTQPTGQISTSTDHKKPSPGQYKRFVFRPRNILIVVRQDSYL